MQIDLDIEGGVDDYKLVEDGDHLLRVAEASAGSTADGSVSWMVRMEVVEGDLAGRTAVLDWLNFTSRGLHRARLILSALGYDTTKTLDLEPRDLLSKVAVLRLRTEETEHPVTGRRIKRSRVAYDGWAPADEGAAPPHSEDGAPGSPESGPSEGSKETACADAMPF